MRVRRQMVFAERHIRLLGGLLSAVLWTAAPGTVQAAAYFVDQSHPAASDANPGTEAQPFKTIQRGLNASRAGDTVWIKAGVYEESLTNSNSGTLLAPITIAAWSNAAVRIGSILRETPPADQWQRVSNSVSWWVQLPTNQPADMVVVFDGRAIPTQHTNGLPPEGEIRWATYRSSDRRLVINLGGPNPALGHDVKLARALVGYTAAGDAAFHALRNLEFGWLWKGLFLGGHGHVIEDCYFHDIFAQAMFPHGHVTRISRCNFVNCGYAIVASGTGAMTIMEDCLVVGCGQSYLDDFAWRISAYYGAPLYDYGYDAVTYKGGGFGAVFRHNIVADNNAGSLWFDGCESGIRVENNAFWQNPGYVYNEYSVDDSLYLGNYLYWCAFRSRHCTRVTLVDNFFDCTGVEWLHHDRWPLYNSYMVLRGNAFIGIRYGYLAVAAGWNEPYMNTNSYRSCLVDYNRVRVATNCPWFIDGTQKVYGIENLRSLYGWELHGQGGTYNEATNDLTPESMGGAMFTCRLPFGRGRHWGARPILADKTMSGTWPGAGRTGVPGATPRFSGAWPTGISTAPPCMMRCPARRMSTAGGPRWCSRTGPWG